MSVKFYNHRQQLIHYFEKVFILPHIKIQLNLHLKLQLKLQLKLHLKLQGLKLSSPMPKLLNELNRKSIQPQIIY
jgi:hypothetical protein